LRRAAVRARALTLRNLRPRVLRRREQCLRRDAPLAAQPPGHSHREAALPGQDVGCALTRAEQAAKIGLGRPLISMR
jgi:hypothetical protein